MGPTSLWVYMTVKSSNKHIHRTPYQFRPSSAGQQVKGRNPVNGYEVVIATFWWCSDWKTKTWQVLREELTNLQLYQCHLTRLVELRRAGTIGPPRWARHSRQLRRQHSSQPGFVPDEGENHLPTGKN